MNWFVGLLLVYMLNTCNTTFASLSRSYGKQITDFDDKISAEFLDDTFWADNVIGCSDKCLKRYSCLSFFYDINTKRCQLHKSILKIAAAQVSTLIGSKYFMLTIDRITKGYVYDQTYTLWYRLGLHDGRSWMEHRDACKSEGGHLITLKGNDMRMWLRSVILDSPGGPNTIIWHIDGNDVDEEGTWVDEVGGSMYLDWASGMPNNLYLQPTGIEQGQDCLALDTARSYLMNDLSCYWNYYSSHGYVCEITI